MPAYRVQDCRIARRLSMGEAATLLGWSDTKNPARNTRARLRRMSRAINVQLVFGGGRHGVPSWTTLTALRHAGLVDDFGQLYGEVAKAMRESEERVAALERTLRAVVAEVARLGHKLDGVTYDVGRFLGLTQHEGEPATFSQNIEPLLPVSTHTGTRRMPGRPKGSRDRVPRRRAKHAA